MDFLIGFIILVFIIGLIARNKGDGFLDTLSSGFWAIIFIIIVIIICAWLDSKGWLP